MADTPTINVTQLPLMTEAVAAQGGMQATVYNQAGQASRIPIEDMVAAGQSISSTYGLRLSDADFGSADVLAADTADPVAMGISPPANALFVQSIFAGMTNDLTTPYNTNTVVAVRYVGADEPIFTLDVLAMTVTTLVPMVPNTSPSVGNTVFLPSVGLEWYVVGGNALSGTGNLQFVITYITT